MNAEGTRDPTRRRHLPVVFFDLDGTLIDPFEGITGCYRHALEALGRVPPPAADLAACIGPPLRNNLERLLGTTCRTTVEAGIRAFRARYAAWGWSRNVVYPGIPALLATLREAGARLFIATAKPEPFATQVTTHHGLLERVEAVYGPPLDGSQDDKARLLARALGERGVDPADAVMIGDRRHDVKAARENGVLAIQVTWGYAIPGEIEEAGATWVCDRPEQILERLGVAPRPARIPPS